MQEVWEKAEEQERVAGYLEKYFPLRVPIARVDEKLIGKEYR
jgi:hypothetical protein